MCFNLTFVEQLLIWLVCIGAALAILNILVPWLLGLVGFGSAPVLQIIRIIVGVIIAIAVIYLVFDLLSCALSSSHLAYR